MEENKFVIVYKRAPDFKTYPVQVVVGGPVPDGTGIVMNFGIDHAPTPSYTQHHIQEGGKVNTDVVDQIAQVGNIERELFGALFLTIDQAKKTSAWLKKIVDQIEGKQHE